MRAGFTLIEISIVLIIIGLVLGGIIFGQELIRMAELRRVMTQKEQFQLAVSTFRGKYNCIPGDCFEASNFMGADCGDETEDSVTGCNGDGNGVANNLANGEHLKFWMHLSMAGMIPGSYSGRGAVTGDGPASVIGVNTPPAGIGGFGWNGVISGEASGDIPENKNGLSYSSDNGVTPHVTLQGSQYISRADAYHIDVKLDDGMPDTGTVRGDMRGDCNGSASAEQTYIMTEPMGMDCQQSFIY